MRKLKDLAVSTGSYTKDGQEKKRWRTIGALMDDGKGGQFIFIDRAFNPAGVPAKDGSESILVSMFDPKGQAESAPAPAPQAAPVEDIPY